MKETKALENIKQPSVVQRIIKPSTIEKIGANTTFAAGVMVCLLYTSPSPRD